MLHLELESAVPHISLVFREMWDSTALSLWLSMCHFPTAHPARRGSVAESLP